jgi:hypothetical protein
MAKTNEERLKEIRERNNIIVPKPEDKRIKQRNLLEIKIEKTKS